MRVLKNNITARDDYDCLIELFTSAFYTRFVKIGENVVDAGACHGIHTVPMAELVGIDGKVFAFEPNPKLIDWLTYLKEDNDSIIIYKKALFNNSGHREYLMYESVGYNHLDHTGPKHPDCIDLLDTITVELCRMDQIITDNISFIKMDIEGSEFLALAGAEKIILKSKPLIVFENSFTMGSKQYNYSEEEYFKWFSDINYVIYDIHGTPIQNWDGYYSWQCIALPNDDERLNEIMSFIKNFWEAVIDIPIISENEIGPLIKTGNFSWLY